MKRDFRPVSLEANELTHSPGLDVPELQCTLGASQQHLVQVGAGMHHGRHVKGGGVKVQPQVDV